MSQQLQLLCVSSTDKRGNIPLKFVLSRVSQKNINLHCQKIGVLSVHDIKDILETVKQAAIDPVLAESLFNLKCADHQGIYQKYFVTCWMDRSFNECFVQASVNKRLHASLLIAKWSNAGLCRVEGDVEFYLSDLIFNGSKDVVEYMIKHPLMVSVFLDFIGKEKYGEYFVGKIAQTLNDLADVLSLDQCRTANEFLQKHMLLNTIGCKNICVRLTQIQKNKLVQSLSQHGRPDIQKKM